MPHHCPTRRALWCMAALFCAALPARGQAPEFRAMWVSRFEYPQPDPGMGTALIDHIMTELAAANFNAVFFQVRGQADVLYPSPEEVWSPLIGGTDPGYDPLATAIAAAHARGIEFHAYINTHTCWQSNPAAAQTLPDNPDHLFWRHCNAADPERRDWLHHSHPTHPAQFSESNYIWLAPGVPACQAYTRRQILYLVENYDIDGVHFDRIRTPWTQQPSYDPISLARHADSRSNPEGLAFDVWTRDQITRQVRDIYAAIMAVKPHIKVSAAVYSNPATAPLDQNQDASTWARQGAMDMLVPMLYFSGGTGSSWDSRLSLWLQSSGGRHVIAGHITSQGTNSLLSQIALSRTRGAAGNSVFSFTSFSGWSSYANSVYALPTTTPTMSWKTHPPGGIILGTVRSPDGAAVVDAQVQRTSGVYTALSSADGFYSFLEVSPGPCVLTATHPAYLTASTAVMVNPGDVLQVDLIFGMTTPPGDLDRNGIVDLDELAAVSYCLQGPAFAYAPGHVCLFADSDLDGDVDLVDLHVAQRFFGIE